MSGGGGRNLCHRALWTGSTQCTLRLIHLRLQLFLLGILLGVSSLSAPLCFFIIIFYQWDMERGVGLKYPLFINSSGKCGAVEGEWECEWGCRRRSIPSNIMMKKQRHR